MDVTSWSSVAGELTHTVQYSTCLLGTLLGTALLQLDLVSTICPPTTKPIETIRMLHQALCVLLRMAPVLATVAAVSANVERNVTLSYNLSAFYAVAPHHVSVALSVYAPDTDPSWNNADVLTMALDDPDFAFLSKEFTLPSGSNAIPTLLRIGGSYNDAVYYETPEDACPPGSIGSNTASSGDKSGAGTPPAGGPAFCLTRARWAEIANFAASSSMEIIFGVNFFVGRNTSGTPGKTDGPMNMTNLRNWLAMNVELAYPAFRGIELGNELSDSVPVSVYAADVLRARAMVDELYAAVPSASRPWVVAAADNFWDLQYISELFSNASVVAAVDVLSYHHYGPSGVDNVTEADAWSPKFLVQAALDAANVRAATPLWSATGKPTIVSETALAWHSGRNGTSNAYRDGPWYVTQLAGMAWHGVTAQCRQTLRGGNYELVSNNTGVPAPNPDWWTARLFKRVLGLGFFHTSSSAPCCAPNTVFAYIGCRPGGGVSLVYVNAAPETAFAVDVFVNSPSGPISVPIVPRGEYFLTPGEPGVANTTSIRLNGVLLSYGGVGNLTQIAPHIVTDPSMQLVLQPLTYGFVEFPNAPATSCPSR
jgi:hypothetical protein